VAEEFKGRTVDNLGGVVDECDRLVQWQRQLVRGELETVVYIALQGNADTPRCKAMVPFRASSEQSPLVDQPLRRGFYCDGNMVGLGLALELLLSSFFRIFGSTNM